MNKKGLVTTELLRRLWSHLRYKRKIQLGLLVILMVFASFSEILSIGALIPFLSILTLPEKVFEHELSQPIINLLNITEPSQLILPFTIIFCLAAFISGFVRLSQLWLQTRFCHLIGADFSVDIFEKTLYQKYEEHVKTNSSTLVSTIGSKTGSSVSLVVLPSLNIFSSGMILIFVISLLMFIDPEVVLYAFGGLGIVYAILILLTRNNLDELGRTVNHQQDQVFKKLQEGFGGIRDILIDNTQDTFVKSYRVSDLSLRNALANIEIIRGTPRFIIEAVGMTLIAILAYSLSSSEAGLLAALPVLGAIALGAQRLLPVLQIMYSSFSAIRGGLGILNDVLNLLDKERLEYKDVGLDFKINFKHSISLENMEFRYQENLPLVLENISIDIPKGARIGFIGLTGSGKSTLLDIIMGLLFCSKGNLLIDGKKIDVTNNVHWQKNIAHVPQSIYLSDNSISENIAFGIPYEEIDHKRVKNVAECAQIDKTIESLKEKYQTHVGERGAKLSGGQIQRIGIARALYKNTDVIIFDEATSALDNLTELAVINAIEDLEKDITIIMVAHRLTTLKKCQKIIELKDGKILRSGTYKEITNNIN